MTQCPRKRVGYAIRPKSVPPNRFHSFCMFWQSSGMRRLLRSGRLLTVSGYLGIEMLSPKVLSNEYRLLLACARRDLSQNDLAEAQLAITAGIDWALLTRHAQKHGLLCLLWHHLQNNFSKTLDMEQGIRRFSQNIARNLYLSASLIKILEALHTAQIRALAYKGPTLAVSLYDDLALREMSDLDVLIDIASFTAAREVILSLGYGDTPPHTPKQLEARLRSECEFQFSSPDGIVSLDLHWGITARRLAPRFSFDEFWDRRRLVSLGQVSVPTFSAEDTTLVLAVHGGKHLWVQLSWLADFAESLLGRLDWRELRSRAQQSHSVRMLLLGLALANEVLGVPVCSLFEKEIEDDPFVPRAVSHIVKTLFEGNGDFESDGIRWLMTAQLADTRWERLRSGVRFSLEAGPREWQAMRLPDSLFRLYPILRIATLLRTVPSVIFSGRRRRG